MPAAPGADALRVLGAYRGSPAMESPGLPSEGSRSCPAASLPAEGKREERGAGRERRRDGGEENNTKPSHAAQILPSSRQAASHRASGRLQQQGCADLAVPRCAPAQLPAPALCTASAPCTASASCTVSAPCTTSAPCAAAWSRAPQHGPGSCTSSGRCSGSCVSLKGDTGAVLGAVGPAGLSTCPWGLRGQVALGWL